MPARKKVEHYVFEPIGEIAHRALQDGLSVRGVILDGELNTYHTYRGREVTGVTQSINSSAQIIDHIKATPTLQISVHKKLEGNDYISPHMIWKSQKEKDKILARKVQKGIPPAQISNESHTS